MTPIERKSRSEAVCRAEGIPINNWLPFVEDEASVILRKTDEVSWRAMCLCLVAMKGAGLEQVTVLNILSEYALEPHLSDAERKFVFENSPTERDLNNFSWRFESYAVLLWALGYIELDRPESTCDVDKIVAILRNSGSSEGFVGGAELRPLPTILDLLDLTYRYDWACVDARLNNNEIPGELMPSVVYERHYALNWLVNYMDQDWDNISTDT